MLKQNFKDYSKYFKILYSKYLRFSHKFQNHNAKEKELSKFEKKGSITCSKKVINTIMLLILCKVVRKREKEIK